MRQAFLCLPGGTWGAASAKGLVHLLVFNSFPRPAESRLLNFGKLPAKGGTRMAEDGLVSVFHGQVSRSQPC